MRKPFVSGLFLTVLVFSACASLFSQPIVINEIHSAPAERTVPEEFVELYNSGASEVDLSGWFFSDGIDYTFPNGTTLAGDEYIVIAANPGVLSSNYPGARIVGPFEGRLDNDGEEIILRSADGVRQDVVDYGRGFPWPTVGGESGYSLELIHPDSDNNLGGNWRSSNPGADDSSDLVRAGQIWSYRKGTSEASSPRDEWREINFNDNSWESGRAPIGYGEGIVVTDLDDMRNNYSSVFLRKSFEVTDAASVRSLVLQVVYDDGFNAWINGTHVARGNLSSNEMDHDDTASSALENLDFVDHPLSNPSQYLVEGENVLAIQVHNASIGGSSDCFIDARLLRSSSAGAGPTPAERNSVYSDTAPPVLRQVDHAPNRPVGGDPVVVSIKATDADGVSGVTLEYQIVDPGSYIQLDSPEYETEWTAVNMNDAGADGDVNPQDDIWSALIPGSVQRHRRLVRYRIRAIDTNGQALQVPYADDPQPNFAYFVYDGAPSWRGAIQPNSGNAVRRRMVDYPVEEMNRLPMYILITDQDSTHDATWNDFYRGDSYRWRGTLVHGGEIYDHIGFRARGGVWRYAMGKNMWKFDFLRGHSLTVRDDFGRRIGTRWDKLNFSAVIQQGDYQHRGEQGLFESTGFRLFNLVGVEAPKTHFCTFRIIDHVSESGSNQYDGDFWGLYLVIEQMDGRFLDEHDLPDGNLYKMEGGSGDLNNQGPTAVTNKSDLNSFLNTYQNSNPSDQWWRDNLDLEGYYGYRAIVEGIHHYDIAGGKNYFYYLNPEDGRWKVLPWDLDLTWANNMFGSGNEPFKSRVLNRSAFSLGYRNRMREIRDLLYNTDQAYELIDEFAAMIDDPGGALSIVDADRSKWDYHPVLADGSLTNRNKAGHGRFYGRASSRTFRGMAQIMKAYVSSRGSWIDTGILPDGGIPRRPTISYTGGDGFPIDDLSFRSSAFSDPQGSGTFDAIKWRVGEIAHNSAPDFDPLAPRPYEIDAVWEYESSTQERDITLPAGVLEVGSRYRVRVRMRDTSGRWSHWSTPREFTATDPVSPFPSQDTLRVTEMMYHPVEGEELEFIEITNIGNDPIDLGDVAFTGGIDFDFQSGDITEILPGEYVVIVSSLIDFELAYDTQDILIAGEYGGRLANGGERIVLTAGANSPILDFVFDDVWYPLTDGGGHSLHIVDAHEEVATWGSPANWVESSEIGGSPGRADGASPLGGRQLPGDGSQDGIIDISDAVSLLLRLFGALDEPMPCEGESLQEGGNLFVFDVNASGSVAIDDAIYLLSYLFQEGQAPQLGVRCLRVEGCPHACGL